MYNFWKANSTVSIHYINGIYIIKIGKLNRHSQTIAIVDTEISLAKSKSGEKLQAHRKVSSKSYRILHQEYKNVYHRNISYGSFIYLKPFYVSSPTTKEMEMCLCIKCLNPHSLYKVLTKFSDNLPTLLTVINNDTNLHELDCINGNCKNNCL